MNYRENGLVSKVWLNQSINLSVQIVPECTIQSFYHLCNDTNIIVTIGLKNLATAFQFSIYFNLITSSSFVQRYIKNYVYEFSWLNRILSVLKSKNHIDLLLHCPFTTVLIPWQTHYLIFKTYSRGNVKTRKA